jgi:quercetin dioxygenase-like cupin family protein
MQQELWTAFVSNSTASALSAASKSAVVQIRTFIFINLWRSESRDCARSNRLKDANGRVTLFAFDKGEGLSEHISPFNALVQVIDGEAEITISGRPNRVKGGELILMPAGQPHALEAVERFKMILTLVRS